MTTMADNGAAQEDEPRRFLIAAAVSRYPKCADWDRPGLEDAQERVVRLFTDELGYRHHAAIELNPSRRQLLDAVRSFCSSPQRREDDLLTMYLSCHGEVLDDGQEHVLLTADTDPADLAYTSLPTAELARTMLRGTRMRRVLLLLDTCYAGAGGNQLAATALERLGASWGQSSGTGLVIVSSAQPHQQATAGLFPRLLEDAVSGLPVGGHGPDTLSVHAIVQHINDAPERPEYQRIGIAMVGLDGEPPAFFPNPRHDTRLTEVDLAIQLAASFDEQERLREIEFTRRLLVRTMGYHGDSVAPAWWFCGRHAALRDLAVWLNNAADGDGTACRVVTAAPGSGKTAVLGLIATLSHPERHVTVPSGTLGLPPDLLQVGAIDVAIYAQNLSDIDVLYAVAAVARLQAGTVGELLDALERQARPKPLTVLIDAVDEASTPETLCATILRPLIAHARGRIRLLLGTRAYLLPRIGVAPAHVIDLDETRYADPEALKHYAVRTLIESHRQSPYREKPEALRPVADAVAQAAGTSFLVARIAAGTLAAAESVVPDPQDPVWQASLPRHAGAAMRDDLDRRLGGDAQRAVDLLRPLAYAQGQGLPWEDLWAPLASEIAAHDYTDEDLLWLRRNAGSYVVEAVETGRSAYRLYHQALADYLREGVDDQAVHAAFTAVLAARVPYRADTTREWARAHPYTLTNLAYHAAQAGHLDQVLADSEYLVHAAPHGLTPHLHQARSDTARLAAAVYRTGLNLHNEGDASHRRQVLALDSARAGARALYRDLTSCIPTANWFPRWATGGHFSPSLRHIFVGHIESVLAVACTYLGSVPVAVTGGEDGTVRLWNLRTGQPLGEPMVGHEHWVGGVACTQLGGAPVAVTSSGDGTLRVWDLHTQQPLGEPMTGPSNRLEEVACTQLDDTPIAVTVSLHGTLQFWDLDTRQPIGEPATGKQSHVQALICAQSERGPVAVTGGDDGTVQIWDVRTRQPVGEAIIAHPSDATALASTDLDGIPVLITGGGDGVLKVWDWDTRQPLGEPMTGHENRIDAVACTYVDGVPVAVTGGLDDTVRLWDLNARRALGQPITGHTGFVNAVACTQLDGAPAALTASADDTVRMWDLDATSLRYEASVGHTDWVWAVACTELGGVPVAVTGGNDRTVRTWDTRTGQPLGEPMTGHKGRIGAVACIHLEDVPVAVTVGDDGSARIWDLRARQQLAEFIVETEQLRTESMVYLHSRTDAVACTQLGGTPIAITGNTEGTMQMWDLQKRQPFGEPMIEEKNWIRSMACTELEGVPVAVTGYEDGTIQIWDLQRQRRLGAPMTGSDNRIGAVACTYLEGVPVAVTGDGDGAVRIWDLRSRQPISEPMTEHWDWVRSVVCTYLDGVPVAVTCSDDHTVCVWDLLNFKLKSFLLVTSPRAVATTSLGDLVIGFSRDIAVFSRLP